MAHADALLPMRGNWIALGVWGLTRGWVLLLIWLMPWIPYDVQLYEGWYDVLRQGHIPSGDPLWQYPPWSAAPIIIVGLFPGPYLIVFLAFALVIDLVIMLTTLHRRHTSEGAWPGVWLWATAGFWIGPVLLARLDILTAGLAVVALAAMKRPITSSILIAAGLAIKLWPAVLAAAWPRLEVKKRMIVVTLVSFVMLGISNIFWSESMDFLFKQGNRGLHAESVGASPFLLQQLLSGSYDVVERSGTSEIVSTGTATVGLSLSIFGFALVTTIVLLAWFDKLPSLPKTDVAFIALLVLVTTSRILSPQFYVWLGAVLALALLDRNTRLRPVALLVIGSALLAQYVYPLRTDFPDTDSTLIQLLRVVLLLGACIWALRVVFVSARQQHRVVAGKRNPPG